MSTNFGCICGVVVGQQLALGLSWRPNMPLQAVVIPGTCCTLDPWRHATELCRRGLSTRHATELYAIFGPCPRSVASRPTYAPGPRVKFSIIGTSLIPHTRHTKSCMDHPRQSLEELQVERHADTCTSPYPCLRLSARPTNGEVR